ncbi:proteasomal ubiquitin receptor adrm1 [Chrysochromulina tobinii]|uniref:Proteasomal ubiquitin receptor adrm1 n=1 Tax=Chrysochromulina tobinii TaxID=1460289 RepID=A0A0M0JA60_9EUKA|nr:proteasomal ubiquitin receptor adrm1 [Chrysochromulina tobinii]|eukprot:KOO23252.1 proteasomal ubiquitin receptor adrm1 [Chrysochromulina sp. CCMP291]
MFGMPGASPELVSMRAGKANLEGTTVTSDPRKGLLIMRKSDDGLTHLIWKDRVANSVVDDLIVFEGDAKIQRVEECKDGFCMLIAFAAGGRKLFFYSQEPRKKGSDWEDVSKEKDLMDKFHRVLTGESATAREGTAGPPVALNDVLRAEDVVPKVDEAMEAALAEHLPSGDSAAATLSTPQMAQAAMRFNEALYQGDAFGLMRELNLNPTGPGLEPFLRALQASTDAAKAKEEEEEPVDKMDES